MRDCADVLKQARTCANRKYCDLGGNCEYYDLDVCCQGGEKDILQDAADAIEELLITTSAQKETIEVLRARNSAQADMLDGEWTSMEEQLPEKHKVVLFYIPWNKTNMIGWIDEGGGINLEGYGKCYDFSLIKPSHWMPLPEAPKEVE